MVTSESDLGGGRCPRVSVFMEETAEMVQLKLCCFNDQTLLPISFEGDNVFLHSQTVVCLCQFVLF